MLPTWDYKEPDGQEQKNRIQNKENEKTQGEKKSYWIKGQKGIQNTTRSWENKGTKRTMETGKTKRKRKDDFSEKKKKASPKSTLSLEQDLASVESTSSSCSPIAYTTSALYKAVNSEDRASKKANKVCRSSLKAYREGKCIKAKRYWLPFKYYKRNI